MECRKPTDPLIIIAIDGYSSSGKSTMARTLAKQLGYTYVDTGAMYRAVTLFALRNGMAVDGKVDNHKLIAALPSLHITFGQAGTDGIGHCLLNGEDIESEIRGLTVSEHVSPVAAIPEVRHFLVAEQQKMGSLKGVVMDGRDIGTTVFPHAELKIFVNASAETRARRRYKEMIARGDSPDYEEVLSNIRQRDLIDTTRKESPLRRADDAILLENDEMTVDEQQKWLCNQYQIAIQHLSDNHK